MSPGVVLVFPSLHTGSSRRLAERRLPRSVAEQHSVATGAERVDGCSPCAGRAGQGSVRRTGERKPRRQGWSAAGLRATGAVSAGLLMSLGAWRAQDVFAVVRGTA